MEDEDFLAAVEADNAGAPVEEPVVTPAEPEPTPEAKPQPEESANPLVPPVVEAKPDPGFVPITSMLDEREKRQKLEAELAQLRASQQQPQPEPVPNMFEDPEGFQAYQQQFANQTAINVKLDLSEDMARQAHGDELVDQARDWALQRFQSIPGFQAHVLGQRNPYGFVVQEYRKAQIADQITPEDLAQFQAWKTAQAQIQTPAPPTAAAPPNSPRSVPPRSLASAPSAGGVMTEVEQSDQEIFEETFTRN
jgi:hypothetical protein